MGRVCACLHPSQNRRRPSLAHRTTAPRATRRRLPLAGLMPCPETLIPLCLQRQHQRTIVSRPHRRCHCFPSRSSRRTKRRTSRALWRVSTLPTRSSWSTPVPPTAPLELARSFNASFIEDLGKAFSGYKNFAHRAVHRRLDSVARRRRGTVRPNFKIQIRALLPTNPPTDAFYIKRRNLFLGRWIKHGGFYPDPKLRLFRRTAANFIDAPHFEESPGARDHRLRRQRRDARLRHHPPRLSNARPYIEHMDRYSSLGAELLVPAARSAAPASVRLQRPHRPATLSSCGTTSSDSASSTAAKACCCICTTRPTPVGSMPRRGRRARKTR